MVPDSTSALLRDNCDEFIYYEDLSQPAAKVALRGEVTESKQTAFTLLFEALVALRRNNREILGASHIKDTIRRVHPSFSEGQYGYRSFSALLQDAQKEGMLELGVNQRAGTLVVTRFGDELKTPPAPTVVVTNAEAAPTTVVADVSPKPPHRSPRPSRPLQRSVPTVIIASDVLPQPQASAEEVPLPATIGAQPSTDTVATSEPAPKPRRRPSRRPAVNKPVV